MWKGTKKLQLQLVVTLCQHLQTIICIDRRTQRLQWFASINVCIDYVQRIAKRLAVIDSPFESIKTAN